MKLFRTFISAILAGVAFSIGGAIYLQLSDTSKFAAAFLFSIGILAVLFFDLAFFSDKASYIFKDPRHIDKRLTECFIVFFGNAFGAILSGLALSTVLGDAAKVIAKAALASSPMSIIIKSVICGMLMFIVFRGYARQSGGIAGCLIAIMSSMAFILCGFNNAITDVFFYAAARRLNIEIGINLIIILVCNAIGAVVFAELYEAKKDDGNRHSHHRRSHQSHHHHSHHAAENEKGVE